MQPQSIPENRKFSPFLVFFIISSLQVGVGALGFQRIIAQVAGYDSWQSVILAGIMTNIVMWIMYKQLKTVNGDLVDIHHYVFGKSIGVFFNILFICYYSIVAVTILRSYIEVIQVWMFPDLSTFWFAAFYLLLCIYIIYGGIRTVVGIAFFAFVLPFYIIYIFGFAIPYSDFRHFFPLFNHSFNDILKASQNMTLTYMGYETIMFFYPFIKHPEKSEKWAQLSLGFTTLLYLYMTITTFAFYAQAQLQKNVWATLTTFKIVHLPVVERFEYIGIANWCLIILPNVCLTLWSASRILKKTLKVKQKLGVVILSLLILFSCLPLRTRFHIDMLSNIVGNLGFIINYIYIPVLLLLVLMIKKVKKKS